MKKVEYTVIARKNPQRRDEPALFYAQMKSKEEVTIGEISESIRARCTVTKPDVLAVIAALEETAIEKLQNGQIVRLGDLGSFHLTLRSQGSETEKDFSSSRIKVPRIRFTPGRNLKNAMKTINFTTAHICKEDETETQG